MPQRFQERGSPFLLHRRSLENHQATAAERKENKRPLDLRGSRTQKQQLKRFYGSFLKETGISTDTYQGIFSSNKLLYSTKQRNQRPQRSEESCQVLLWGGKKEAFAETRALKS